MFYLLKRLPDALQNNKSEASPALKTKLKNKLGGIIGNLEFISFMQRNKH